MKLFEYEAKRIIAKYGIQIPKNVLVNKQNYLKKQLKKLDLPLVIKSQILVSGRKKAGGILFANSIDQALDHLKTLFENRIKNKLVTAALVEEKTADYISQEDFPKPIVAYLDGSAAPPEKRMGHAGAIIMGQSGTVKSKVEALHNVGVKIAEKPSDVAKLLNQVLEK